MRKTELCGNREGGIASGSKSAVAIGKFDGLHRGHIRLIEELKKYKARGFETVITGFDKNPMELITGEKTLLLTPKAEWEKLAKEQGIDVYAEYPVTASSMSMPAEDFVRKVLVDELSAGAVVAGPDCSFGYRGLGDISLLESMGKEYGFETRCVPKLLEESGGIRTEISTSYIKNALLANGKVGDATLFLGRPYSFCGTVEKGRQLGRTIGLPTANLIPPEDKFVPLHGVYLSESSVLGKKYRSLTNIGKNPTVKGEHVTVETHIPGFDEDIYGCEMCVELVDFLRPEMSFESLEDLRAQILRDLAAVK